MMKMAASCSSMAKYLEETSFQGLVEAFRSISVQEIASVFCEAQGDVDLASQILCNMQQDPGPYYNLASIRSEHSRKQPESNYHEAHERENLSLAKQKLPPPSTAASVADKTHSRHAPGNAVSSAQTRTEKLDSSTDRGINGRGLGAIHGNNVLEKDLKDFLFNMLAAGFHMERDVIQHILEQCGYDIMKSMERLLDLSPALIDAKRQILVKYNAKLTHSNHHAHSSPASRADQMKSFDQLPQVERVSEDPQREIKQPMHVSPEKTALIQEIEKTPCKQMVTEPPISHGSMVQPDLQPEPPTDVHLEPKSDSVPSYQGIEDDDSEDDYHLLRREVKEHWNKMKEYYGAAVDAFTNGDHDEANKLMEQGHLFHEMAREADEKSSHKIFEINGRNMDAEDEISIDLRNCGAKEAIRLLKSHFSSLVGITSIKYLKLMLESDEEHAAGGAKRSSIVKFMEKQQISWTGEENSGVITINLDVSTQNS